MGYGWGRGREGYGWEGAWGRSLLRSHPFPMWAAEANPFPMRAADLYVEAARGDVGGEEKRARVRLEAIECLEARALLHAPLQSEDRSDAEQVEQRAEALECRHGLPRDG